MGLSQFNNHQKQILECRLIIEERKKKTFISKRLEKEFKNANSYWARGPERHGYPFPATFCSIFWANMTGELRTDSHSIVLSAP